ncbi:hypothetical protein AltI4_17070 [Alteromonas sp. I4]|nr:hypothetical protein AltI4_17070 [Alteromonas sp. I4]
MTSNDAAMSGNIDIDANSVKPRINVPSAIIKIGQKVDELPDPCGAVTDMKPLKPCKKQ